MRRGSTWLLCALALALGWLWWNGRPVAHAEGVIAPDAPAQSDLASPQPPIPFKDAVLHPLASFSLTARVLARDDHHFDPESELSPTDLALGWGRIRWRRAAGNRHPPERALLLLAHKGISDSAAGD